jgi:hypothetical protein
VDVNTQSPPGSHSGSERDLPDASVAQIHDVEVEVVVAIVAGSSHRERQRAGVVRNAGISYDSLGTIEMHFGRDRSVAVDRHPAELRTHPIIAAAFTKHRVGEVIGHGKHRLTVAGHKVLRIDELTRVTVEDLQAFPAAHLTRPEIQGLPPRIVARPLAFHENGERLLQGIGRDAAGLQLSEDVANHGPLDAVVVCGDEAVTALQAMILIDPVALQTGYWIGSGVPSLNVFLRVFLGEHGRGQQDENAPRRQYSMHGTSSCGHKTAMGPAAIVGGYSIHPG